MQDDFATYTSISSFLSDPRGIYSQSEDAISNQWSFVSPGYGSNARALRFTYADRSTSGSRCTDYTIQRNLEFPSNVQEVWIEWAARFSTDFTTKAPGSWNCASNPDFKYAFVRTLPSSRFSWKNDIYGSSTMWDPTAPGQGDGDNAYSDNVLHDGQWHVYRVHARISTNNATANGRWRGMIDGVTKFNFNNVTLRGNSGESITSIYGFKLWGNLNQGPDHDMELDLGYIRVYNTDPGWTW